MRGRAQPRLGDDVPCPRGHTREFSRKPRRGRYCRACHRERSPKSEFRPERFDDDVPCPAGHVGNFSRPADGKRRCLVCQRQNTKRKRVAAVLAEWRSS